MTLDRLRSVWPASTVQVDGQPIEIVRTSGEGHPVIFLSGAQGTAESFYHQLLAWGSNRPLVSVTYPASTDGAELADFTVRLADTLNIQAFDLVGTSLGGYIAQWVGVRHPARVRRMVIGNTFQDPVHQQSPEKLRAVEHRDAASVKADLLARLQASPDSEVKTVQLELIGQKQTAELVRSRMLAVQRAVCVPPLGISDTQLLLVDCDDDPLIKPQVRQAIREHYPRARCCTVEGGGHYPYILRPHDYNAAVGAFLEL